MELKNRQKTEAPKRYGWKERQFGGALWGDVKRVKITKFSILDPAFIDEDDIYDSYGDVNAYELELNRDGNVVSVKGFANPGVLIYRRDYNYLPDNEVEITKYNFGSEAAGNFGFRFVGCDRGQGIGTQTKKFPMSDDNLVDIAFWESFEDGQLSDNVAEEVSDVVKYNDKGELVEKTCYWRGKLSEQVHYDHGKMVEQTYYYEGVFRVKNCMEYDSEGRMVKKESFDAEGNSCGLVTYTYIPEGRVENCIGDFNRGGNPHNNRFVWRYDNKDQQLEMSVYTAEGTLIEQELSVYNSEGVLVESCQFELKNGRPERNVRRYNSAGNLEEEYALNPDDTYLYRKINTYDEQGLLVESVYYRQGVVSDIHEVLKYNEKGDRIELSQFCEGLCGKKLWEYDEQRNLIKYEYINYYNNPKGSQEQEFVREITYWD